MLKSDDQNLQVKQATMSSRKAEILQAALECFSSQGIEGTTIDMIRERSGASVGSLYHHFGSKDKIASALYLEGLRNMRALQDKRVMRAQNLEQFVKAIVGSHVDWIGTNPDWARFLFSQRPVVSKSGDESVMKEETHASYQQLMTRFFELAPEGYQMPYPKAICVSLLIGPVHEYARAWLSGRQNKTLVSQKEFFAQAAWRIFEPPTL